ncbi:hypothetical protein LTR66_013722, partial [Elasticomyces elasticus]
MPLPEPHPALLPPDPSTYYRTQRDLGTVDELDEPIENQTGPHALPLHAMPQNYEPPRRPSDHTEEIPRRPSPTRRPSMNRRARERPTRQTDEPDVDPLTNMSNHDMRTLMDMAERIAAKACEVTAERCRREYQQELLDLKHQERLHRAGLPQEPRENLGPGIPIAS